MQCLLAATLLTGMLQMLANVLRFGSLMRFVITKFVNALAILILMDRLPALIGMS